VIASTPRARRRRPDRGVALAPRDIPARTTHRRRFEASTRSQGQFSLFGMRHARARRSRSNGLCIAFDRA
jgi:hypothetical protein